MKNIKKILFITLSNIGDVILTLPALDALRENYPHAKITVMVAPRPAELFENNPAVEKTVIFDKRVKFSQNLKLLKGLRKENFDLVVDLRNSILGPLIESKYRFANFFILPKKITHMRDRHLYKVMGHRTQMSEAKRSLPEGDTNNKSLNIKPQDLEYIDKILKENHVGENDLLVVVSPGARSHIKRWSQDKFAALVDQMVGEFKVKIILVGSKDDAAVTKYIGAHAKNHIIDLGGKTNLMQLGCLLNKAALLITNDSATLHLGSYLDIPVLAIFGPTNELKYGPWSRASIAVKKDIYCRPCEKAQCKFGTLKCMEIIQVEDVLGDVRKILGSRASGLKGLRQKDDFKRILVVRTDRIGDVLLSTPVIKALRENYPRAFIAMMVRPYAKEIIDGNPYLDEVILFDKEGKHRNWFRAFKFARNLNKRKFDAAIILHPANTAHLVVFHAGIPRRVGYDRKHGFLLTDKLKHVKELGQKHEVEYNLDLVRYLGIEPKESRPFMPIKAESERWAEDLFKKERILKTERILAIHPGASCPSKIWPNERFAEVADKLIEKYGFKVFVLAGPKDTALAQSVIKSMRHAAINLGGKTSVSQMASLLKRCNLFISNDSGPVHVGSAVGAPTISIFGRAQKGLGPKRWGPLGEKDRVLHKNVGCVECLAHNCVKGFACLRAITVDDVIAAADAILT